MLLFEKRFFFFPKIFTPIDFFLFPVYTFSSLSRGIGTSMLVAGRQTTDRSGATHAGFYPQEIELRSARVIL